jgi:hypothetical protein
MGEEEEKRDPRNGSEMMGTKWPGRINGLEGEEELGA